MANANNKKNPASLLVAVLILLLVVIALIVVLRSCASTGAAPSPAPASPAETLVPTAAPTPAPTPTSSPTPSPSPAPDPTPSPTSEPKIDASGSFRSDTGTYVNTVAEWTAVYAGDGRATVTVTLYAESYTLQCKAIRGGASITVGGETKTFDTPDINIEKDGLQKTLLGSAQFTVALNGGALSADASAVWGFRGTYSDTEIDGIASQGTISA